MQYLPAFDAQSIIYTLMPVQVPVSTPKKPRLRP